MASDVREIRILTVDDHALLRKGIAALINPEPGMKLVAEAASDGLQLENICYS
jgi:DNA-binding NarL/FixJ family response regulator